MFVSLFDPVKMLGAKESMRVSGWIDAYRDGPQQAHLTPVALRP